MCVWFHTENEEKNILYCLIFMENHQYFIKSEIIIYKIIYLQKKKYQKKWNHLGESQTKGKKKLDPVKERKKKKRKENDLSKRDNLEKKERKRV